MPNERKPRQLDAWLRRMTREERARAFVWLVTTLAEFEFDGKSSWLPFMRKACVARGLNPDWFLGDRSRGNDLDP